jgi:lipopolysaccharide export system ATP-binding protein
MIRAVNLTKSYKKKKVVEKVSLELKKGEIVGLLGPNGAGKTTTFYMISGLIKAENGEIFFKEKNINKLTLYERACLGITYLPQESSIFRKLTVEENIMAPIELSCKDKKKCKELAESLMEDFGILHIRKSKGYEISGGERRRVEIARALTLNPHFILLDEPFAGIDPIIVSDLQKTIKNLKSRNIGILISDHNVRETLKICDRAYILNEGKILLHGTPDEIIINSDAKKHYLGKEFTL